MKFAPIGVISRYNLLERLEPSGPGELFRARDTQHGRTVTIRLLPADFAVDPPARTAMLERARAMAATVLARIRIYRARKMTQVLMQPALVQGVHSWNRPHTP